MPVLYLTHLPPPFHVPGQTAGGHKSAEFASPGNTSWLLRSGRPSFVTRVTSNLVLRFFTFVPPVFVWPIWYTLLTFLCLLAIFELVNVTIVTNHLSGDCCGRFSTIS